MLFLNSLSMWYPRLCTRLTLFMELSPIVIEVDGTLLNYCIVLNIINSVFSSLHFRKFVYIQTLMKLMFWRQLLNSPMLCSLGPFTDSWKKGLLLMVGRRDNFESHQHSCEMSNHVISICLPCGDIYRVKRTGPRTLHCGTSCFSVMGGDFSSPITTLHSHCVK